MSRPAQTHHLHLSTASANSTAPPSPSSPYVVSTPRLSILHARHASALSSPLPPQPIASSAHLPALLSFFSRYVSEVPAAVLSAHSLSSSASLTLPSLADGAVLGHILRHLSPAFFLPHTPSSPSDDSSSTLHSLLASIETALEDHAGHPVNLSSLPSPQSSGALDGWLYPLLSASLLCCVYGDLKEEVVDEIMTLGEDKQLALMAVISEWEERLDTAVDASEDGDEAEAGSADVSPQPSPSGDSMSARLNGVAELMMDELKGRPAYPRGMNGTMEIEHGSAASAGSGSGSGVSQRQYEELKERLHAELRERDKQLAALRQQMSQQAEQSKAHEQQLAAEVDNKVRERTVDLERQLTDLRKRADTSTTMRDKEQQIASLHQQLTASTTASSTLQRERDRLLSQLLQRDESMREQTEQLSVLHQRLEEYSAMKEKLARMQQRLEVVSDLKEQYAMVEEEAREKGERLTALEEELRSLRELRNREREWREERRDKERELMELRLKSERWEEEVAECRGELRQLREEQRRWKEEQREWQANGLQQRSVSGSIESLGSIAEEYRNRPSFSAPVHSLAPPSTSTTTDPSATTSASTSDSAASIARYEDELRDRDSQLQTAERRLTELTRSIADWEHTDRSWRHERTSWQAECSKLEDRVQKGEAVLARLKQRWDEERQRVRLMRARVSEYEAIVSELDGVRVEEELLAVRERLVLSSVLHGVGAEVQRLALVRSLERSDAAENADDARHSGG